MTAEQKRRFHELMTQDFVEMQLIYEAVALGITAEDACTAIIGGSFNLTPIVAKGIGEHVNVSN